MITLILSFVFGAWDIPVVNADAVLQMRGKITSFDKKYIYLENSSGTYHIIRKFLAEPLKSKNVRTSKKKIRIEVPIRAINYLRPPRSRMTRRRTKDKIVYEFRGKRVVIPVAKSGFKKSRKRRKKN